jgi:rare lipoprotein A
VTRHISKLRHVSTRQRSRSVAAQARLVVHILLLFSVSMSSAYARTSANSGAQSENVKQSAPPQGNKLVKRKGLSGKASFYSNRFHGRKTASGHPYYKDAMTAAHRSLPLGTWVRVVNERNGYYVVVQITDRGPFAKDRVIDLSLAAATSLDMLKTGTVPVSLEVVQEFSQARSTELLADARVASGYGFDQDYY